MTMMAHPDLAMPTESGEAMMAKSSSVFDVSVAVSQTVPLVGDLAVVSGAFGSAATRVLEKCDPSLTKMPDRIEATTRDSAHTR